MEEVLMIPQKEFETIETVVQRRIDRKCSARQSIQFPSAGVGVGGAAREEEEEEEEGNLVTGPVEQWLKRMIKGSPSTPKPQTSKPSTTSKGSTSKGKSSSAASSSKPTTSKYQQRLEELRQELTRKARRKEREKWKG
ncbi:hypothetical protein OS493_002064 [Desmophyllum pertusum]|uniref:Uncharacterized protein n=1 Tax=Desmophyllum pertusum TaxID=174260 RepID=A0A9W9Z4Z3_9CNID|nr:hypothetical protein OS493_002064 [Desmophyllum pertusum]